MQIPDSWSDSVLAAVEHVSDLINVPTDCSQFGDAGL